jgi:hypothetical protein
MFRSCDRASRIYRRWEYGSQSRWNEAHEAVLTESLTPAAKEHAKGSEREQQRPGLEGLPASWRIVSIPLFARLAAPLAISGMIFASADVLLLYLMNVRQASGSSRDRCPVCRHGRPVPASQTFRPIAVRWAAEKVVLRPWRLFDVAVEDGAAACERECGVDGVRSCAHGKRGSMAFPRSPISSANSQPDEQGAVQVRTFLTQREEAAL